MGYDAKNGLGFVRIPNSLVVLSSRGVYKESHVYGRYGSDALYAKHGSGFIQLNQLGTSAGNVGVDAFHIEGIDFKISKLGRLTIAQDALKTIATGQDTKKIGPS